MLTDFLVVGSVLQSSVGSVVYLDTPCEDAGGHLLVEAGVLLTVRDEVSELSDQEQVGAVFVQSFHQSLFGSQTTHHHRVVFVQRRQPVQEADEQLNHLLDQSQQVNVCQTAGLFLCFQL